MLKMESLKLVVNPTSVFNPDAVHIKPILTSGERKSSTFLNLFFLTAEKINASLRDQQIHDIHVVCKLSAENSLLFYISLSNTEFVMLLDEPVNEITHIQKCYLHTGESYEILALFFQVLSMLTYQVVTDFKTGVRNTDINLMYATVADMLDLMRKLPLNKNCHDQGTNLGNRNIGSQGHDQGTNRNIGSHDKGTNRNIRSQGHDQGSNGMLRRGTNNSQGMGRGRGQDQRRRKTTYHPNILSDNILPIFENAEYSKAEIHESFKSVDNLLKQIQIIDCAKKEDTSSNPKLEPTREQDQDYNNKIDSIQVDFNKAQQSLKLATHYRKLVQHARPGQHISEQMQQNAMVVIKDCLQFVERLQKSINGLYEIQLDVEQIAQLIDFCKKYNILLNSIIQEHTEVLKQHIFEQVEILANFDDVMASLYKFDDFKDSWTEDHVGSGMQGGHGGHRGGTGHIQTSIVFLRKAYIRSELVQRSFPIQLFLRLHTHFKNLFHHLFHITYYAQPGTESTGAAPQLWTDLILNVLKKVSDSSHRYLKTEDKLDITRTQKYMEYLKTEIVQKNMTFYTQNPRKISRHIQESLLQSILFLNGDKLNSQINPRYHFTEIDENGFVDFKFSDHKTVIVDGPVDKPNTMIIGPLLGLVNGTASFKRGVDEAYNLIRDSIKNLENCPVFIMGYGSSGSGKTSVLFGMSNQEGVQSNGLFASILQDIDRENCIVTRSEFYGKNFDSDKEAFDEYVRDLAQNYTQEKHEFLKTRINNPDNPEVVTVLDFFKHNNIWRDESDPPLPMVDVLKSSVEKTNRHVAPTLLNNQSSRSHVILKFEFRNKTGDEAPLTLFIGDFAGVENIPECDDAVGEAYRDVREDPNKDYYDQEADQEGFADQFSTQRGGVIISKFENKHCEKESRELLAKIFSKTLFVDQIFQNKERITFEHCQVGGVISLIRDLQKKDITAYTKKYKNVMMTSCYIIEQKTGQKNPKQPWEKFKDSATMCAAFDYLQTPMFKTHKRAHAFDHYVPQLYDKIKPFSEIKNSWDLVRFFLLHRSGIANGNISCLYYSDTFTPPQPIEGQMSLTERIADCNRTTNTRFERGGMVAYANYIVMQKLSNDINAMVGDDVFKSILKKFLVWKDRSFDEMHYSLNWEESEKLDRMFIEYEKECDRVVRSREHGKAVCRFRSAEGRMINLSLEQVRDVFSERFQGVDGLGNVNMNRRQCAVLNNSFSGTSFSQNINYNKDHTQKTPASDWLPLTKHIVNILDLGKGTKNPLKTFILGVFNQSLYRDNPPMVAYITCSDLIQEFKRLTESDFSKYVLQDRLNLSYTSNLSNVISNVRSNIEQSKPAETDMSKMTRYKEATGLLDVVNDRYSLGKFCTHQSMVNANTAIGTMEFMDQACKQFSTNQTFVFNLQSVCPTLKNPLPYQ